MNSGVYIKSIFDVLDISDLKQFVNDLDLRQDTLKEMFAEIPQRATEFSAGYDLAVLNDEVIPAHESRVIAFGHSILIENPAVTGVIVPRSSLAKKKGLLIAGGPQYIYPGQGYSCLAYKFINYSETDAILKAGDKIAQVVFIKYPSWILGDFDAMYDMESADVSVLPDPLDATFMSPLLNNNLEFMDPKITLEPDTTNRVLYNFQSPVDMVLEPAKVYCIMTGLRARFGKDQVFILKNVFNNPCVILANTVGVIDSDYYGNSANGGEIGVLLLNRGHLPVKVNIGDAIASGAIYYYEKIDNDIFGGKRVGGFGSTDKKFS